MGSYNQGLYIPKNPEKYVGDPNKIRYMSSWELSLNKMLDMNPNILQWSSEEVAIPYVKPTDGKVHRYFPDYWIKYKDVDGVVHSEIIEVKPLKEAKQAKLLLESNFQTMPPVRAKKPKNKAYEQITMVINAAKWKAAIQFCNKYGMKFRVVTEKQLFRG